MRATNANNTLGRIPFYAGWLSRLLDQFAGQWDLPKMPRQVFADGAQLTSDCDAKENFSAVNAREVLAKVASLPVTQWNYRRDSKGVQHIGPMAQDFQAAFGLDSRDDKHISAEDESGVALVAIQGLNRKLEIEAKEKGAEIEALKQQNDSFVARLNELEIMVNSFTGMK
jgi:hypothetical protein